MPASDSMELLCLECCYVCNNSGGDILISVQQIIDYLQICLKPCTSIPVKLNELQVFRQGFCETDLLSSLYHWVALPLHIFDISISGTSLWVVMMSR